MTTVADVAKVAAKRRQPSRVYLRVDVDSQGRGILRPADQAQAAMLRAKKLRVGQVYAAAIVKVRNPGYWFKVHSLMIALADNVERLSTYHDRAHDLLKRIQLEARIECDEIMVEGGFICFVPRSFNFDSMDEAAFDRAYKAIMRHIAATYFVGMSDEKIEELAAFAESQAGH